MDRSMSQVDFGEYPVTWRFMRHGLDGRHPPRAKWEVPENALSQELPNHWLALPFYHGAQLLKRCR
jgi:hypothetical protein